MALYNGSEGVLIIDNTTVMENSSLRDGAMSSLCSRGFYWPIHSPLILFLLFIVATNGSEIVLIICKETLRTVSNTFLVSLAVSDLLFGVIGIPLFLVCSIQRNILVCVFSSQVVRFTAISSVFHLLLIACDRYTMIVYSMKYHALLTRQRATVLIASIWILACVSSFIQLSWYSASSNSLLSMFFMYSRILVISLRHILAVRRRKRNLDQPVPSIGRDLRGTFILLTMMLIFVGCWLPFFLLTLQDHISERFFVISPGWTLCLILYFRFLPPLTNPILCAFCKQDFRRAWGNFLRRAHFPIPVNFYSLASASGTRERTISTAANEIANAETTRIAGNS